MKHSHVIILCLWTLFGLLMFSLYLNDAAQEACHDHNLGPVRISNTSEA